MTDEVDRSNFAVVFHTFPDGLRCYGRPRGQFKAAILGLGGMALSLLPLEGVSRQLHRLLMRGFDSDDLFTVALMTVPFLLASVVFVQFLRVIRRPRGIEIKEGIVTLSTPDSPSARHVFQRANLGGARLIQKIDGNVDLQILRRRAMSVVVLRNYHPRLLAEAVDAVNDLVVDDHHWAFEVILVNQQSPKPPSQR